ncbi:MAG TPA: hypothetical protein EYP49_11745 [Anaerolineae bacterium]|nr:hypothetical protein [Anaerolineae bacterium]
MMTKSSLRVGVADWRRDEEFGSRISSALGDLGCEVIHFLYNDRLPGGLDVVLSYGPWGSLVPLANQLLACPPSQRPLFALWMTEQLSNPAIPEWVHYLVSVIRSRAERVAFREQAPGEWLLNPRLRWLTTKALRFRYYGDLHWLCRQGVLSVLAVGSKWIATFLRERGFDPIVAYIGSHPDSGADLGLERDVPVLWIGKLATERRTRLLKRIRAELLERGVKLLMIDGVENPYVFGEERTILLNRTKIVLSVLRAEWDNHSMRYFLAAPNRAMIITEPTLPHTPFLPGVHLVEAPIEQMADTICHYLAHEEERQLIAEQAYRLATRDLTMEKAVGQILEQIVAVRQSDD